VKIEKKLKFFLYLIESLIFEKEKANQRINFVQEEIEIRIESIKIELDELGERLKGKLNDIRESLFRYHFTCCFFFVFLIFLSYLVTKLKSIIN
jgi:hypothetical protein